MLNNLARNPARFPLLLIGLLICWVCAAGCAEKTSGPGSGGNQTPAAAPQNTPSVGETPLVTGQRVVFNSSDGVELAGFLVPGSPGGPGVCLFHMMGKDRNSWGDLPARLNAGGCTVLAVDLRGHGESRARKTAGGEERLDYRTMTPAQFAGMVDDVGSAVRYLTGPGKADPNRVVIIGASIGANAAFLAARDLPGVVGCALLSPGLDYRGLKVEEAAAGYGERRLFLVAARGDRYSQDTVLALAARTSPDQTSTRLIDGDAHGTQMLDESPQLVNELVEWVNNLVGGGGEK